MLIRSLFFFLNLKGDNRYGGPRVVDVNNSSGGHGPTHDRTAEAKNGTGVALEPSSSGADQAARSAARAAEDKAHAAAELSVLSSLLSNNSGGGASASGLFSSIFFFFIVWTPPDPALLCLISMFSFFYHGRIGEKFKSISSCISQL